MPSGRSEARNACAARATTSACRVASGDGRRHRRAGHGQPEAHVRGEVERRLRITRTSPRRRRVGERLVFLPGPVRTLAAREPGHRAAGGRPIERPQVVELGQPEAGGVERRHIATQECRPAAIRRLAGLHLRYRLGRRGNFRTQIREPRAIHQIATGHYEADCGINVDHAEGHEGQAVPVDDGQYMGSAGSTCRIQDTTPPCTCTASENPAAFSAASASADRTPLLQ